MIVMFTSRKLEKIFLFKFCECKYEFLISDKLQIEKFIYYFGSFTSKVFSELLLHFQCSFIRFFRLFFGHPLVHFPLNINDRSLSYTFQISKSNKKIVTYITDSTDFGLMKMAIGYSCATCNLLMAFPLTSRIQCFPLINRSFLSISDIKYFYSYL